MTRVPATLPHPPHADLQMVNITLRVLSKPDVEQLPRIFRVGAAQRARAMFSRPTRPPSTARAACTAACLARCLSSPPTRHPPTHTLLPCVSPLQNLGLDWDERVLPSIGNEVLKAVVAQYQAEQLLTQVRQGGGEGGANGCSGRCFAAQGQAKSFPVHGKEERPPFVCAQAFSRPFCPPRGSCGQALRHTLRAPCEPHIVCRSPPPPPVLLPSCSATRCLPRYATR